MTGLTWALLMQTAGWGVAPEAPTVGDTVVVERELLVADPAASVRLAPLEPSELVEPLHDPEVIDGPGGFIARYTVALFAEGEHAIPMPDVELVYPDGRVETVVGGAALVIVQSVLPEGDSLPPARASRPPLERPVTQTLPAALLVGGVVLVWLGWGMARWRSRPRPAWEPTADSEAEAPLPRWIAAGEPRAVATVTMHRLRDHVAQLVPEADRSLTVDEWLQVVEASHPSWPIGDLSEVMRALERASFAPAFPSDVIALSDEADLLLQSLETAETAETAET